MAWRPLFFLKKMKARPLMSWKVCEFLTAFKGLISASKSLSYNGPPPRFSRCTFDPGIIDALLVPNSSMHFCSQIHRCTFGPKFIDALLVPDSSMHFWPQIHRCTFGPKFIDALLAPNSSMHFWSQIHQCTFGPKFIDAPLREMSIDEILIDALLAPISSMHFSFQIHQCTWAGNVHWFFLSLRVKMWKSALMNLENV